MSKILSAVLLIGIIFCSSTATGQHPLPQDESMLWQKYRQLRRTAVSAHEIALLQKNITRLTDLLMNEALQNPHTNKWQLLIEIFDDPSTLHYDPVLARQLQRYCRHNGLKLPDVLPSQRAAETAAVMRQNALQCSNNKEKQQQLFRALLAGDPRSALLLAVLFNDAVLPDQPMAINSALLAAMQQQPQAEALLLELDKDSHLAMAMLAIWQNQLRLGEDLQRASVDGSAVIIDLSLEKSTAHRQLEALMLENPDAFFLSGIVFRLLENNCTAAELKTLFQRVPPTAAKLPVLVSATLLAGEVEDAQWQLEMSGRLLAHLATDDSLLLRRGNYRAQLLTILPDALKYPAQGSIGDVNTYFPMLWNLAIDMRLNALLALNKNAEAERFLQKYPRRTLPTVFRKLEQSMLKRFAKHLVRRVEKK